MNEALDRVKIIREEVSHLGLRAEESLVQFIKRLHAKAASAEAPAAEPLTPNPPPLS